jgi:hypothetical protein
MGSIDADVGFDSVESINGDQVALGIDRNGLHVGVINAVNASKEAEIHLLSTAVTDSGGAT